MGGVIRLFEKDLVEYFSGNWGSWLTLAVPLVILLLVGQLVSQPPSFRLLVAGAATGTNVQESQSFDQFKRLLSELADVQVDTQPAPVLDPLEKLQRGGYHLLINLECFDEPGKGTKSDESCPIKKRLRLYTAETDHNRLRALFDLAARLERAADLMNKATELKKAEDESKAMDLKKARYLITTAGALRTKASDPMNKAADLITKAGDLDKTIGLVTQAMDLMTQAADLLNAVPSTEVAELNKTAGLMTETADLMNKASDFMNKAVERSKTADLRKAADLDKAADLLSQAADLTTADLKKAAEVMDKATKLKKAVDLTRATDQKKNEYLMSRAEDLNKKAQGLRKKAADLHEYAEHRSNAGERGAEERGGELATEQLQALANVSANSLYLYFPDVRQRAVVLLPMTIALIITFLPFVLSASTLSREREAHTLETLLVAPGIGAGRVFSGKLLLPLVATLVELLLLLIMTETVYRISVKSQLPQLMLYLLPAVLSSALLGLTVSAIANSSTQGLGASAIYFLAQTLLSGFLYPIDEGSVLVQGLSKLFPLTFVHPTLSAWMFGAHSIPYVVEGFQWLLVQCAIYASVSVVCFHRSLKRI